MALATADENRRTGLQRCASPQLMLVWADPHRYSGAAEPGLLRRSGDSQEPGDTKEAVTLLGFRHCKVDFSRPRRKAERTLIMRATGKRRYVLPLFQK